jgi:hypothetical protein
VDPIAPAVHTTKIQGVFQKAFAWSFGLNTISIVPSSCPSVPTSFNSVVKKLFTLEDRFNHGGEGGMAQRKGGYKVKLYPDVDVPTAACKRVAGEL